MADFVLRVLTPEIADGRYTTNDTIRDEADVAARGGFAAPLRRTGAYIALIFDDGASVDYTTVRPLLESKGVRGVFALVANNVGNSGVNWQQVQELQTNGHEIANHSANHVELTAANASLIQTEIYGAHQTFLDHDIRPGGFIYPQSGGGNALTQDATRALYTWAAQAGGGPDNTPPLDMYQITRTVYSSGTTLGTITGQIDAAVAGQYPLFLFTHPAGLPNMTVLTGIIDYAQAQGVPILTVSQIMAKVGNVFDASNPAKGTYTRIDSDGTLRTPEGGILVRSGGVTGFAATQIPNDYPAGKITIGSVSAAGNTDWPVTGVIGRIEVNRLESNSGYHTRTFVSSDGQKYFQWSNSTGTSWGSWSAPNRYRMSTSVSGTALAAQPSTFSVGRTEQPTSGTNPSGDTANGMLSTVRTGLAQEGYTYQEWHKYGVVSTWTRTATSTTAWTSWVQIAP